MFRIIRRPWSIHKNIRDSIDKVVILFCWHWINLIVPKISAFTVVFTRFLCPPWVITTKKFAWAEWFMPIYTLVCIVHLHFPLSRSNTFRREWKHLILCKSYAKILSTRNHVKRKTSSFLSILRFPDDECVFVFDNYYIILFIGIRATN